MSHMSKVLAPAVLEMMDNLGYRKKFVYFDSEGGKRNLYRDTLVKIIENSEEYFQPYISPYESQEDLIDKMHRFVLGEFMEIKDSFMALSKRKNEAQDALKWIESLGIIYKRQIITEKFIKSFDGHCKH